MGTPGGVRPDPNAEQRMTEFTLAGYEPDGSKRWELVGEGASVEDDIVTIHKPNGIGREPGRTAYLTAAAAQMRQSDRHVRLEHDVVVHTSDGLWLSTPLLHWIPDQNQLATESPVRLETDRMLLRGIGARGLTQLKQATIFTDVELVLSPAESQLPGGARQHVTITCDGPLSFDYENEIATFEQNVHIQDPGGDLYSDTLIAYLNGETHTIRYAEAAGRVRIVQHQNTANGERAIYEPEAGTFSLVGQPSLLIYPEGHGGAQIPLGGLGPGPKDAAKP
jgi:LPS export ABC transporter protein LptC